MENLETLSWHRPATIVARLADTDLNTLIFYSGEPDVMFEYIDKDTKLKGRISADDPAELLRACGSMVPEDCLKATAVLDFPRAEMENFMAEKWTANTPKRLIGFNLNTYDGLQGIINKIEYTRHVLGEPVLFDALYKYLVARHIVKCSTNNRCYWYTDVFPEISREELVTRLARGWEDRPALYLLAKNGPRALGKNEPRYIGVFRDDENGKDWSLFNSEKEMAIHSPIETFDLDTADGMKAAMKIVMYQEDPSDGEEYFLARSIVLFPWLEKSIRDKWFYVGVTREELAEWLKNGWHNRPEIIRMETLTLLDICCSLDAENVFLDFWAGAGKDRRRVRFTERSKLIDVLRFCAWETSFTVIPYVEEMLQNERQRAAVG